LQLGEATVARLAEQMRRQVTTVVAGAGQRPLFRRLLLFLRDARRDGAG